VDAFINLLREKEGEALESVCLWMDIFRTRGMRGEILKSLELARAHDLL
jgi:hypothetical protein